MSMELARVTLICFEDDFSLEVTTNCGLLFFLMTTIVSLTVSDLLLSYEDKDLNFRL